MGKFGTSTSQRQRTNAGTNIRAVNMRKVRRRRKKRKIRERRTGTRRKREGSGAEQTTSAQMASQNG